MPDPCGFFTPVPGVFDCMDCGLRVSWIASSEEVAAEKWNTRTNEDDD